MPVYRGSTIYFDTVEASRQALAASNRGDNGATCYGTRGLPTTFALSDLVASVEGRGHACRAILFPSGLSAAVCAMQTLLRSGDHLLMSDAVYGPARAYAQNELARFGVDVTFFDPLASVQDEGGLPSLFKPNTRLVYLESPASYTFEVLDVPAIAALASARGAKTVVDNAWASPLFAKPFDWGVDVSIVPLTKYWNGHSDVLMGAMVMRQELFEHVWPAVRALGMSVSSDDAFLVLRGARTAEVRMLRHQDSALEIAKWMEQQPGVARVLHPGLPSHPQHALWRRDFSGSSGLFSIELEASADPMLNDVRAQAFCNGRRHFGIGASWGGFDSLAFPIDAITRSVRPREGGPLIRLSIGLEDPLDLIDDLRDALRSSALPSA